VVVKIIFLAANILPTQEQVLLLLNTNFLNLVRSRTRALGPVVREQKLKVVLVPGTVSLQGDDIHIEYE
jgi:hypothetical protein